MSLSAVVGQGTGQDLRAFVIVVTKGRPDEVAVLVDYLERQTYPIDRIALVGTCEADLGTALHHPLIHSGRLIAAIADRPGLCRQRNYGLGLLQDSGDLAPDGPGAFVAFFDDDYRPADDWLALAAAAFGSMADIVGLTGRVLADGISGPGLTEAEAEAFLTGARPPQRHGYGGQVVREVDSAYGCNMAFRSTVFAELRFDETLPLYGWQEDRDFTGQARAHGRVIHAPDCRGVHLGAKGGRSAGKRLGYSQIANPAYLVRKGTVHWRAAANMAVRNLIANHLRSLRPEPWVDRRGRAYGNWLAIADLLRGRASPTRVLDLRQ